MTSIMTNVGALAALSTLRDISEAREIAEGRMSTGQRVGQASQNAAYWSIAATMRSDDKALSAVQDALNLGSATVEVAYQGLSSAIDVVDEIKAKLVAASEPGVDRDKVNKEIEQLKGQLESIASSASFNGVNWLQISEGSDTTAQVAASFYRDLNGGVYMETIETDLWSSAGGSISPLIDTRANATNGEAGILTSTRFATEAGSTTAYVLVLNDSNDGATEIILDETTTDEQLDDMIATVDGMLQMMADSGATFGSIQSRISLQTEFMGKLRDWMADGIGTLVDADMDEEATRIKALDVQEQLAIQALSIANNQPQSILSLFN
ncbi:flagellin N-terminal helical domain-containing protein [Rhizobium sp. SL86]|uniref:flagellin N-terminal helical domain-containing protein n=1 Tax=Rhizobium sp. SL86 TaxID=2995148 RepID=UPI002273997F|nr:flagellin [Rhizobium sp. SL86]MCY1664094.1 flagellin [Rhizobium sp. SL86]